MIISSSSSIISELNKEFPAIWLVRRFLTWRYIHRFRRSLLRSRCVTTLITATKEITPGGEYNIFEAWLLSSPISASKRGGQLLNHFFIYSKDITPNPGYLERWRIFKMTAVALGPKILSRTLKEFKNRKRSGYVRLDYQPLFGKRARAPPPNSRLDSWTWHC